MNRSLVVATALLVPALAFVSCKEDGNTNPVGPDNPNTPSAKAAPKITAARAVKPRVHVALREGVGAQAVGPAQHDPLPFGTKAVTCLDGSQFGVGNAAASDRFDNDRGCEVNTYLGGDQDGPAGLRLTSRSSYVGKRIDALNTVNARFAGGSGGDYEEDYPYWEIPIDECEDVSPAGVSAQIECESGTATDGFTDEYARINFYTCTDDDPETTGGDQFTGQSRAEDDNSCDIEYDGCDYDNWDDFERGDSNNCGTVPELIGARIARTNGETGAAEHILILADYYSYGWHGLIHRVNIQ